jgi:hypothetical protein
MSTFQKGDRVDFSHLRDGEVLRVGRATLWAVFRTPGGNLPIAAPLADFRPHRADEAGVRIGAYLLRSPGSKSDKVQLYSARTGEMMETDEAQLESWLDRFWRNRF